MVTQAVLKACDARDGVTDGLLNNPMACTFDVASLQCKAGDAADCLTALQVASMKRVYSPAKTASGQVVFPGKAPGSESGFGMWLAGQQAPGSSVGWSQVAYNDAEWDARTFVLYGVLAIVAE